MPQPWRTPAPRSGPVGASQAPANSYNFFCPVAKACEVIEPRWTLLLLTELWQGSTHFNEIGRGVPGISPTLMSKRLREMEANGLITREVDAVTGEISYTPTPMANDLMPAVMALGMWAHRNIDAEVTLEHLDARVLMWNVRRKIKVEAMPPATRHVIQFIFLELPRDERNYWLIARRGAPIDLCLIDPGHNVDLYVTAELKALTSAWMGYSNLRSEIAHDRISLIGSPALASTIGNWMVRSCFAKD